MNEILDAFAESVNAARSGDAARIAAAEHTWDTAVAGHPAPAWVDDDGAEEVWLGRHENGACEPYASQLAGDEYEREVLGL